MFGQGFSKAYRSDVGAGVADGRGVTLGVGLGEGDGVALGTAVADGVANGVGLGASETSALGATDGSTDGDPGLELDPEDEVQGGACTCGIPASAGGASYAVALWPLLIWWRRRK